MTVHAWILDGVTRERVWGMEVDATSRVSGELRRAEDSVRLDPGPYELYFFSGYGRLSRLEEEEKEGEPGSGSWWERWFSSDRRRLEDLQDDLERCHVTVSARDVAPGQIRRYDVSGDLADALLKLNRVGDSRLIVEGFALRQPMRLRVYTIFELTRTGREAADYGWIVDAESREMAWHPRDSRSHRAGGGDKNRLIDDEIVLEAGRYLLYYGTDDSHSFEEFNTGPPYDPFNWGITLLPGKDFDAAAFDRFEPAPAEPALFESVQVGDGAFHEQGFRLKNDARLWIHAIGEYDYDDDQFYDYAWIVDVGSDETVWEMTASNTEGAGGAQKNRKFDGIVELPRGDYLLFQVTDGSHAYGSWNDAAPFEPERWGVSLRPGPGFDSRDFALLGKTDLDAGDTWLVRIVRVGDDARIHRSFTVDGDTRVRIRALGEGRSGRMYDFGYVRDESSGRIVWEMSYDDTEHAGGADKNRRVVADLVLEPGQYEAVYISDDSHSFHGWNASRPDDPMHWGLTIRRVER
jgi:hypothetical protein